MGLLKTMQKLRQEIFVILQYQAVENVSCLSLQNHLNESFLLKGLKKMVQNQFRQHWSLLSL